MMALLPWAVPLLLAAAALPCIPLWLRREQGPPPARGLALGLAIGIALAGWFLYQRLGNYPWAAIAQREQAAQAAGIPRLEAAARAQPASAAAQAALGDAWVKLERWGEARAAFQRAVQLSNGRDPSALAGLGQVLVLTSESEISNEALALFERALALDPRNVQSLFYSGLAHLQAGRLDVARARFVAMVAEQPPQQVKDLLQKEIAAIDARVLEQAQAAKAAAATSIAIEVRIAPELAGKVPTGASLFLFVPGGAGSPPLAARKLAARFPQQSSVSSADAMIPGRELKPRDRVVVTARVTSGSSPVGKPGDLYGTVEAVAGDGKRLVVTIDRVQGTN